MARTIMIASGKGGTGKSMVAINLAASVSHAGFKSVVVDMSSGMRTLDIYLGLEYKAIWDIGDVINETCALEDALLKANSINNLYLLPATQRRGYDGITDEALEELLNELKKDFDYIFLDCPSGVGIEFDSIIELSDTSILVVTPDYASLRIADILEDMIIRGGIADRKYIVNGMNTALNSIGTELTIKEINQRMKSHLIGMIPYDNNIRASLLEGVPIVAKRNTYISENFDRIVDRLISNK